MRKSNADKSPQRGRPRNKSVDTALLDACITVLGNEGFGNLSLAKVATLAHSSRAAIYRRWPNKTDMALAAVERLFALSLVSFEPKGDVYEDVRAILYSAVGLLTDPRNAKAIAALVSAAHHVSDNPKLKRFVIARRGSAIRSVLEAGMRSGQLPPDFDYETAIDALVGPIFYRFLVLGMPFNENDVDALIALCLPPQ